MSLTLMRATCSPASTASPPTSSWFMARATPMSSLSSPTSCAHRTPGRERVRRTGDLLLRRRPPGAARAVPPLDVVDHHLLEVGGHGGAAQGRDLLAVAEHRRRRLL